MGYDADGNNTGNAFRGTTRTHVWDEADRLKEVKASAQSVAKFLYDDQGERTKKKTNAGDAWYVNQFYSLLPNGRPTKNIFAGETRIATKTDAIWMQKPVLHFYHPDHLGTTSYISDAEQRLVQHEMYFAYGDLWRAGEQEETDLSRPNGDRREYLFTSKEWDVDTSLYYFGARYFDPHASVWQSTDPLLVSYVRGGPSGGVLVPTNLAQYTYSWNNPISLRDPNGLCTASGTSGDCTGQEGQIRLQQQTSLEAQTRAGIREGVERWGYDPFRASVYGYLKATGQRTRYEDVQGFIASNLIGKNVPSVGMSQSSAAFADLQLHAAGAAIVALTGGIAGEFGVGRTEVVERAMSRAELAATRETGLLRGGRGGTHFVSDSVNSSATRAQLRLSLENRPEVRVRLEVPAGQFSPPTRVEPLDLPGGRRLPGGGMERTASGPIPVRVLGVDDL